MNLDNPIAVIRGGGDLGTGVAHTLARCRFRVLVLEIKDPLVIRRRVSFAQALFDQQAVVEQIQAVRADSREQVLEAWQRGHAAVMIDPECKILDTLTADVVVDATLAKRNTGVNKTMAPVTIALGPGFDAGKDVHAVVETRRGHDLGRVILSGRAEPDTGIPEPVGGFATERVLRAPCDGILAQVLDIGDAVQRGDVVCRVNGQPVPAAVGGVLRGLLMNARPVKKGLKIGDVDPRAVRGYCFTISDKARAVAGGVLTAFLNLKKQD